MNPAAVKARYANTKKIFLEIMMNHGISRKELVDKLKVSAATVTLAVNDLLCRNLIIEVSGFSTSLGRRTKILRLNEKRNDILTIIVLSKSAIRFRICDLNGQIKFSKDCEMDLVVKNDNAVNVVRSITDSILRFIDESNTSKEKLLAATFIVPGLVLQDDLIEARLYNWQNFPLIGAIHSCLNIPVLADTLVRINGWYESLLIPEQYRSLVYLMLEPGVGISYFKDSKPLTGMNNSFGEIGHVSINQNGPRCYCGNYGCIEGYCDNEIILQRFQKLLDANECPIFTREIKDNTGILDYPTVFRAYKKGSIHVQNLLKETAEYLGMTLLIIRSILDPDCIVISGRLISQDDYVVQLAFQYMREHTLLSGIREPKIQLAYIERDKLEISTCAYTLNKMLDSII